MNAFEGGTRSTFRVPENPENSGRKPVGRGGFPEIVRSEHKRSGNFREIFVTPYFRRREKFVTFKISPIFFRAHAFLKSAALGNRPSQCFQTSRASEKNRTQDRCGAVRNSAAVRSAVRKMLWTIIFHLVIFSKKFRLINLVIFFYYFTMFIGAL